MTPAETDLECRLHALRRLTEPPPSSGWAAFSAVAEVVLPVAICAGLAVLLWLALA